MWIAKAFKRDKNALIVRKTDDELTRYVKQKRIQKDRQRFDQLMQDDEEKRAKGWNIDEKKMLYQAKIDSL